SELAKLTHAVNQQTSVVTTAMTAMLKQFQSNPPPAQVKAVEEISVTCGATGNYNQSNLGYRPQDMVKNELRNEMKTSIQTSLSNQTNEIKNMMASLLQMNTASTSRSGTLSGNTITNPKGELKAITTRSGLVTEGPIIPNPPKPVNPEEDECVEETYTDPDHAEYNIKVPPPPPVQQPKPPIQRNFVIHTRDSLPPRIPYPSRMLKKKQQEKDDIQIQEFWNMFKQLHLNIILAEAFVLMPKYQKMLKALLSNKEKLQELANIPLNENCSAVILKKLPEKLRDPGKFLIPCGFSELKCKAIADLGANINLMPLSVWKKLGLPDLIPTQMTLELANRAICTPDGIARDVFVPVGRPFLRTARALIDVYGEEMILRDEDERLSLNMKHDTELPDIDSFNDIHPHFDDDPLSGSTTYSANSLLEEFADELALITNPPDYDDNRTCDIESDIREIEFLLFQSEDFDFKDSIDQSVLTHRDDLFVDPTPEMFVDEQPPDYSFPPRFDVYPDDFLDDVLFSPDNEDKRMSETKRVKDATYHREKMLLCKQEEAKIQLSVKQADWRDHTDDELEDQELEAYYMYMAQLQEVSPDAADSDPSLTLSQCKRFLIIDGLRRVDNYFSSVPGSSLL
nr:reverse transcriptase domain-containing protein [Tanacetum cinerariifolium]